VNLIDELHAVATALHDAGIDYAVCGGIAVTIHGAIRTTKDIDILISRGDVSRVMDAVRPLGYAFAALPQTFDEGTDHERHLQRVTKVDGADHLILDLLISEAGYAGFLERRIDITLADGPLSVVSLDALLEMKRLAGRTQDLADIENLEALGE